MTMVADDRGAFPDAYDMLGARDLATRRPEDRLTPGLGTIEFIRQGARWAVKHNGGFLGYAASEKEAARLVDGLRDFAARRLGPIRSLAYG